MQVTMRKTFDTKAEAETWVGTIPRTEKWTKEGDTAPTDFVFTQCKVEAFVIGEDVVWVAEIS